jgi:dATP pyrophosphohydrolase
MTYKLPRSVQVVVFAETQETRQYLLLKRVTSHGGFWQSVTGSLEEGETHTQTAVREVHEETGITCREDDLIDLDVTNTFEILPQWRIRYAPGVTHNEERCFALRVEKCEVTVDAKEHQEYVWVDYETAMSMLYWNSNKRAFAALKEIIDRKNYPKEPEYKQ